MTTNEPLVKLGPISHIGTIVKDVKKTAEFYTTVFGIGPWEFVEFDMGKEADYFFSYGEPAAPHFKAALYYSGDVFIELVEVVKGETCHTKHFADHGEGFQHLCFVVENMKEILAKLKTIEIEPVLDYQMVMGEAPNKVRVHETYLNTADYIGGATIQLLEMIPVTEE